MDIRNTTKKLLELLENCHVVEGFLHIMLMDEPDFKFNNHSYPKLRKITGYLLLHRVFFGLRSIGQLFPNLYNSILCYDIIDELYNSSRPVGEATYTVIDNTDISQLTNGFRALCDKQVLNIAVVNKTDKVMKLKWSKFKTTLADKRLLLSYFIFYKEALHHQNVSTYYDVHETGSGDGY